MLNLFIMAFRQFTNVFKISSNKADRGEAEMCILNIFLIAEKAK